jgi:hypothetical protein
MDHLQQLLMTDVAALMIITTIGTLPWLVRVLRRGSADVRD